MYICTIDINIVKKRGLALRPFGESGKVSKSWGTCFVNVYAYRVLDVHNMPARLHVHTYLLRLCPCVHIVHICMYTCKHACACAYVYMREQVLNLSSSLVACITCMCMARSICWICITCMTCLDTVYNLYNMYNVRVTWIGCKTRMRMNQHACQHTYRWTCRIIQGSKGCVIHRAA